MKRIDWINNENINENINIDLDNIGHEEELEIFIKLWGDNNSQLNIVANHLAKETKSRIKIRAIIDDKAKLKIKGTVRIAKGMKGSDTYFDAKILTLSEKAVGNITPGLEIDENDVKAGHAASITNVSERDMFYLMSRGLDQKNSERLIVEGFLKR